MKAVLPLLDESSDRPYYLQLYDYLREAILQGDIGEGERLPSLRSLSRTTGLSLTTVEKAYSQLLVEGYIQSRDRSGFYADRVIRPSLSEGSNGDGNRKKREEGLGSTEEKICDGIKSVPFKNSFSDNNLSFDDPVLHVARRYDPDCFDFNKWKKCMNRVLNEESPQLFFEGDPQGEISLRQEIARYLYRSRGVDCSPGQIFLGAGTQQITGLLANILKDLHIEHVALEDPGFLPVRNTFRDRGFAITDVSVAEDGLVLEKLPVNIRSAAYVSPSNHAFTGAVMPIGRRYEMLRWAMENDSYIIEDDYDSELRYFGKPIPPIKSLADDDRVIYLGAFSSTLFAAVRISYMVLPPEIALKLSTRLSGYSQTCSKLEQLTLAMFMKTGLYQTHIRKLRKLYAQKLSLIQEILRKEGGFIQMGDASSGIQLLLTVGGDRLAGEENSRTGDDKLAGADNAKRKKKDAGDGPASSEDRLNKLIRDAESLGIPAAPSGQQILLYYNQIPLEEIPSTFQSLIRLWKEPQS